MPRIKTTRTVRFALWALRVYLLILLSLIGLKFGRMALGSGRTPVIPAAAASPGTP